MAEECDALVIGGGPAGATTALLLARSGWSVAVLERKEYPRRKVCGEYLSGTNRPLFAELGVLDAFDTQAGPDIRRVALFAHRSVITANLPKPAGGWGRALARERLDTLLLDRAAAAGARVVQPAMAERIERHGGMWQCHTRSHGQWSAPIVVAAHGSWDAGRLPTQPRRRRNRSGDMFGFKAHFRNAELPADLMPLVAFPGGYGGMVEANDGIASLSLCIRRDQLANLRAEGNADAGRVVESHLRTTCVGVRKSLEPAERVGPWLAAGPIRPGLRLHWPRGVFAVGNAAGEAHPCVAEGISMAMQSAWILTRGLLEWRKAGGRSTALPRVAAQYAWAWRRAFLPRLVAASAVVSWVMSKRALTVSIPLVNRFPRLLTCGALASGKAQRVVRSNSSPVYSLSSAP
jgi:flavin-dependent dehydrogenase